MPDSQQTEQPVRVFTVGFEQNYDRGILEYGSEFKKLGRRSTYPGGFAACRVEDAFRLIHEFDQLGKWAVYELEADWERDTVPSENGWWHALINDSLIVRKVVSAQDVPIRSPTDDNQV